MRPQHTVLELATVLGLTVQTKYRKGDEADRAKAVVAASGPVLVAWEHEAIPDIVGNNMTCPQKWPGSRFDRVWVLDAKSSGGWSFDRVPQLLLSGDSDKPIKWLRRRYAFRVASTRSTMAPASPR